MTLEPIKPVKPVAPWQGGKRALASRLAERIEAVPHARYVEPFVGMGGVFFRRRRRPQMEVINDINSDVVTLVSHPAAALPAVPRCAQMAGVQPG